MAENGTNLVDNDRCNLVNASAKESSVVAPRIDVLETDDEFLILADMPGVTPEKLDIRFENGELTLHGRREAVQSGARQVVWEYEAANFYRSFRLSDHIAADRISAELKNGVLSLHLPKAEAVKPRRISVKG